MDIQVKLFAGLAERLGSSIITLQLEETIHTVGQLKQWLETQYPEAASQIQASFVAVNQEFASSDLAFTADDEIALIPPVSGGDGLEEDDDEDTYTSSCGNYVITPAPLSQEAVSHKVITPNDGATLVFVGTTREMTGTQKTVHLEYEAYAPMAIKMLAQIGQEISERWPGAKCAISHRTGKVDVAEASVVIAVSTPHRDSCYEASRYAIERLKQKVPIWKKEIWEDGSEWKGHQTGPWDPSKNIT